MEVSSGRCERAEKPGFDDREWQNVSVPHTWNGMQQFDLRNYRDTLDITEMYRRDIGWYRCQFQVPPHWKNQYVKVDFLAANQTADVWLNGQYLGQHKGGYTGFHFGLQEALNPDGTNVLAVKVNNRFDVDIPPHTADYNFQGGLYREVRLMAWPKAFVKALEIQTPKVNFQEAEVLVNITLKNGGQTDQRFTLITSIVNPYQEIIQSKITETEIDAGQKITLPQAFLPVKHPQLWSPDNPACYQVMATLYNAQGQVIDQFQDNFGFRSLEFTPDRGFFLNGEQVKLKGVNVHQDLYGVGWAMDSTQKRRDYLMIKAMGANFVRMSHYPHHPYELYLCDSLGLMVYPEIPVVNTVGEEKFTAQAVAMMEEMIIRDRNHPSIIMWGVGNEYYRETFTEEVAEWALRCTEAVAQKAKALDPSRPTIQAQNDLKDERIMPLTDIQGRNRYFGWYTGADVYAGINHFEGFGDMMTREHQKHPQWKILVTEYGAEGKYGYHVNQPKRFDHSETYQLLFHKAYWHYIAQHDWVLGGTIWNMFDFTSFAKVGNIPHINQKGTATFDRKPKSLYYFYQSQWSQKPMVYIYSHTWTHRTAPPGVPQSLEVFSNCEAVELWLNGQSLGKHQASEAWVWPATLKVGLNRVLAVGFHRGEVVKDELSFYFYHAEEGPGRTSGTDAD
ncbi:MAG: glycoside hydrolase family 2 protein [Microscillaceae bacterium]|nr:glycoside hydrolase family 2 protein [Microscillaceae bacterium]